MSRQYVDTVEYYDTDDDEWKELTVNGKGLTDMSTAISVIRGVSKDTHPELKYTEFRLFDGVSYLEWDNY